MPQLSTPPVLKCLEFSINEEVGNWKANKSFLHPLYLPLTSFLTFLLSFIFLCRNISAWAVTPFTPLGLCLMHEICHSHHQLPLGTGSLQLHVRREQISSGSHSGWAGGRGKCLNGAEDRCSLHTVEPLGAKRAASTKDVLSSPVH